MNLVVLATPEDIEANAEYIRLASEFVRVPGGDVKNNYANVELIANVAKRCQVDAVWPGCGLEAVSARLPRLLHESGILYMGQTAEVLDNVGSKAGGLIAAQSLDVPTVPWSGSGLVIPGASHSSRDLVDRAVTSRALHV
eukprot:2659870-Pyramimonas_sp.AAC.1